jgi:hydrogenase/urease accessory protein HupE
MPAGRSRLLWSLCAALLLSTHIVDLSAHAGSVAFWRVSFAAAEARSQLLLSLDDVVRLAPGVAADSGIVAVERLGSFGDAIVRHFVVVTGGAAAPATILDARVLPSGLLELHLRHGLEPGRHPITLRTTFHELTDATHRVIARVERHGPDIGEAASPDAAPLIFDVATIEHVVTTRPASWRESVAPAGSARAMLLLGIEHILTGYDHLVFLVCLLVPGGTFRSRVAIVSAFTAAHSLTLVLAAMRLVTLPAQFVEPAIAISIAYVALENLLTVRRWARAGNSPSGRIRRPSRWPTAFGFGLIHGFGFAGLLDVLDLPAGQWVASVLAFNLGVELGQLAVVAIALPVIVGLARSPWHRRVVQCTSVIVFGFAVGWFVDRLP